MQNDEQEKFIERIEKLDNVDSIIFDSHIEHLMKNAIGVIAMGGYNTFCEILSFNKPALIIPRTKPRLEQHIRASRAQELGLMSVLNDDGVRETGSMITALRQLPQQRPPSDIVLPGLLDGLPNISRLVGRHLEKNRNNEEAIDFATLIG